MQSIDSGKEIPMRNNPVFACTALDHRSANEDDNLFNVAMLLCTHI